MNRLKEKYVKDYYSCSNEQVQLYISYASTKG